ncbi:MAG: sulfite exporter TauE/SafE family protein [Dehalococcoidia bacterium]|nr:sulfite exporter TauE/SafE family protein [Dehalococcoidia bacterium]
MEIGTVLALSALVLMVAALYSSVGHGGASGYLAVLSLFAFAPVQMATTALVLNVLVAVAGVVAFWRAGHLSWRLLLPFAMASVPAAFLGGLLGIKSEAYSLLLAAVLAFAALRLGLRIEPRASAEVPRKPPLGVALTTGGVLGFLSGVVGVGGGIFLSPLLILWGWATIKTTAAVSAGFIVVNSLSGLLGRALSGNFEIGALAFLIPVAFVGGLLGSYLGARRFSGLLLRRLLAVVLAVAAVKLVLTALS